MKFAEAELRQITEETWRIVLGEEIQPCAKPLTPGEIADSIAACAQVTGNWQLAIILHCSMALARRAAALMFGKEERATSLDDTHDTMCELVNIISGNVKGLLSGSSHLSLPNLVQGQDFKLMFPRHILLSEAAFTYEGETLIVVLLGEDKLSLRKQSAKNAAQSDDSFN
jgi:hypothetical protein